MNMHPRTAVASTEVLEVEGMTCASCVAHVERALKAVPASRGRTSILPQSVPR